MRVLVDMDGVLCDIEGALVREMRVHGFEWPVLRAAFDVDDKHIEAAFRSVVNTPGFFLGLEPIQGAIGAMKALQAAGHDVYICTAPLRTPEPCVAEKFAWVRCHLGDQWVRRVIVAKDKTLVKADWLVDDKVQGGAEQPPPWKQILFAAGHNRHVPDVRGVARADEGWNSVLATLGVVV